MSATAPIRASKTGTGAVVTRDPALYFGDALRYHWPEYLMEAAELAIFMISACLFTVLLEHPSSPVRQSIDSAFLRRFLNGLAMGLTAIAIVYSPMGQQSGAHFNPAFTLSFWRLKKINEYDAVFYIVSQFIGGAVGVGIAELLVGKQRLAVSTVNFVVTIPGPQGGGTAFVAEALISFLVLFVVLIVSSRRRLAQYTPLFVGALLMLYITFEAPVSGMSMNPARTFGSAIFPGVWNSLWIYFTAPPLGMLAAAELFMRLRDTAPHCAKIHHHNSKRCIFHCAFESQIEEVK